MAYWLIKSEPDVYSIDDLKRDKVTEWDGVRNYQARNNMQAMEVGDICLYYHSNAKPPHVAGIARVAKKAAPDETQFDKKSKYFDPKATPEKPRWFCPDVRYKKKFKKPVGLDTIKAEKRLKDMVLVNSSRLSVQPVTEKEYKVILELAGEKTGEKA